MSRVVFQRNRHAPYRTKDRPTLSNVDESFGACLLKRTLSTKTCGNDSLHRFVRMLEQSYEVNVTLGEGVGLLARRGADLYRWVHVVFTQQISKLSATVKHFFRNA